MLRIKSNTYQFYSSEEEDAKEIRLEEDHNPGDYDYSKGENLRWIGKLGQWACEDYYPDLEMVGGDHSYSKFDMRNRTPRRFELPNGKLTVPIKRIYEIKTRYGNRPLDDNYLLIANWQNFCDYYIGCYYHLTTKELTIVGWFEKIHLKEIGTYYECGAELPNKKEVKPKRGVWLVNFNDFPNRNPDTLPLGI